MLENYLENVIEIYSRIFDEEEEEKEKEKGKEEVGEGEEASVTSSDEEFFRPMDKEEKRVAARLARKHRKVFPKRYSNSFHLDSPAEGIAAIHSQRKGRGREEGEGRMGRRKRVLPQVVAHSMGGLVALHVLQRRPDLFHSILFAGCPFEGGVAYIKVLICCSFPTCLLE
jgi:hypothetical protein